MLQLIGTIAGTRQITKTVGNQNIVETSIGVTIPVPNGYADQTQTVDIRLDRRSVEGGAQAQYQKLVGRKVAVPVYVKVWKSKAGNVGFEYHLSGEGAPVDMTPRAAAS